MIMNYRYFRSSRLGLALMVVATGCLSVPAAEAAEPGYNSTFHREPQGPIFKTLDALAGGIESILERTVLSRRKTGSCDAAGCDAIGCDDACDAVTLQQLEPLPRRGIAPGQPLRRPLPQVPADRRVGPPVLSSEKGWIESFTPSPPSSIHGQPRPATPQNQHYDTLPDPFLDDPQYSR